MYRRNGLSDQEILIELEGDNSGDEFSDSDDDEYEMVASAVRAQIEQFVTGEDVQPEDVLRELAEQGSILKNIFLI